MGKKVRKFLLKKFVYHNLCASVQTDKVLSSPGSSMHTNTKNKSVLKVSILLLFLVNLKLQSYIERHWLLFYARNCLICFDIYLKFSNFMRKKRMYSPITVPVFVLILYVRINSFAAILRQFFQG